MTRIFCHTLFFGKDAFSLLAKVLSMFFCCWKVKTSELIVWCDVHRCVSRVSLMDTFRKKIELTEKKIPSIWNNGLSVCTMFFYPFCEYSMRMRIDVKEIQLLSIHVLGHSIKAKAKAKAGTHKIIMIYCCNTIWVSELHGINKFDWLIA